MACWELPWWKWSNWTEWAGVLANHAWFTGGTCCWCGYFMVFLYIQIISIDTIRFRLGCTTWFTRDCEVENQKKSTTTIILTNPVINRGFCSGWVSRGLHKYRLRNLQHTLGHALSTLQHGDGWRWVYHKKKNWRNSGGYLPESGEEHMKSHGRNDENPMKNYAKLPRKTMKGYEKVASRRVLGCFDSNHWGSTLNLWTSFFHPL